jgi:phage regulator Rha-like protein
MVAKDIVYTLASNQSMSNSRGVAKTFGVDRQNIERAMGKWVQLHIIQNASWISQR